MTSLPLTKEYAGIQQQTTGKLIMGIVKLHTLTPANLKNTCTVCGSKIAIGHLYCRSHWYMCRRQLRKKVYTRLRGWDRVGELLTQVHAEIKSRQDSLDNYHEELANRLMEESAKAIMALGTEDREFYIAAVGRVVKLSTYTDTSTGDSLTFDTLSKLVCRAPTIRESLEWLLREQGKRKGML